MLFVLALLAGITRSDCQEYAVRSAKQPAAGVRRVDIIARAGSLRVEGKRGATTIAADGTACAAIEELLLAMRLKATRAGSTVTIEAMVPKGQDVADVGGDFTVKIKKGRGAIRHTRVRGRVSLPTARSSPPR